MTSTYDSAESIATPPAESDLDDEQLRNVLASPLYLQEREASADRSRVYHSKEKTQCPVHLTYEKKVQGNLPQCSHTKENRVKKHFPTEKAFPQDINQLEEKVNFSSGSLIQKKLREQFLKHKEVIYSQKQNLKS